MRDTQYLPNKKQAPQNLGDVLVLGAGVSGRAVIEYLINGEGREGEAQTTLAHENFVEGDGSLCGESEEDAGVTSEAAQPSFTPTSSPDSLGDSTDLPQNCASPVSAEGLKGVCACNSITLAIGELMADEAMQAWLDRIAAAGVRVVDSDTFHKLLDDGERFDVCVASPGISAFSEFYRAAEGASSEVISELEFAWRESAADSVWACVTGTNGKTTTTALLAHIMQTADVDAVAVGNIGDAAITAVGAGHACYIAECSSYQLASTRDFAPKAAVMLGITPDHIHWHRTHEHYAASKWRSIANLQHVQGACAILDATNDEVRHEVRELKATTREERGFSYIPIGTAKGTHFDMRQVCGAECAAFASNEDNSDADARLTVAYEGSEHAFCTIDELNIKGDHNVINALAAASAAVVLGASDAAIVQALKTFRPLEHRIEPCGDIAGVGFYNDSKATNVDATLKALTSFPGRPLVVLFGGRDKGTDLAELVEACKTGVKAAICYGEGGPRFFEALAPLESIGVDVLERVGMCEAFDAACDIAESGEVVLLSPACASFDEFSCFEERGDVFKSYVAARLAASVNSGEGDLQPSALASTEV